VRTNKSVTIRTVEDFNSQNTARFSPISPNLPPPNPAPPLPQVVPSVPVPEAEKKPKSKLWLVLIILFLAIVAVGTLLFFLLRGAGPKYLVYLPTKVPSGFSQKGMVGTAIETGSRYFMIGYLNNNGEKFILIQEEGKALECKPPATSQEGAIVYSDYTEFLPNGAEKGCVVTAATVRGAKKRSYQFFMKNIKFGILTTELPITDSEALEMANSLSPKMVTVKEIVE